MSINLSALMKQRYDTAANWTAQNPTLLAGEIGIESDTKKWKVGTGATAWTSLVYAIGGTYPIVNADIAAGAAIVDTKLATIATAGKVSNSATTAASANTASAIVARNASGNFTAGTITAALTGAASANVLKAGDTMTGVLAVTAGTAALPGIAVSGDPNTGIYSPGADQLAISTGGTGRITVDASGRLLVGTSSARTNVFTIVPSIQYEGSGAAANRFVSFGYNSADTAGPGIAIFKTRASSAGGNTAVIDADMLGELRFCGADGTNIIIGAGIGAFVDGTPGTNDMPGRLVFSTTADGAASPTERFRISSTGAQSSVIPGGSTLYPSFHCRAWVNFNGTGTVALRASGNVSSITDNGVGDYTVNFTTAMADVNYALTAQAGNGGVLQTAGTSITGAAPTTTTARILVDNGAGAAADREYVNVAIFR